MDDAIVPRCSFCATPHHAARKLLAALGAYICDECVSRCNEVLRSECPGGWPWVLAESAPTLSLAAPGAGRAAVSYVARPPKAAPPVLEVGAELLQFFADQRRRAGRGSPTLEVNHVERHARP